MNFLDNFGTWDPSLAFVMGGGLIVNAIATPLILGPSRSGEREEDMVLLAAEDWLRHPVEPA